MPTGPGDVDPEVLRVLLRRLTDLEGEAHGVTDTVLGHLPYAGPGIPDATMAEVGTGLVDAFSTLGDSIGLTRRALVAARHRRPVDIDLTVVHLGAFDQAAR